jgi:NAD(P)-dependent dehydrogenase (short-subunit alcohol dehydrogenase family)
MGKFLIIGGSSGIGRKLTSNLAKAGHEVYATYKTTESNWVPGVNYHFFDVLGNDSIDFIEGELDGLVYCPGSIPLKPFRRVEKEGLIKDHDLHVCGAVNSVQQVLSNLKKSSVASIVLISSVAGDMGFNYHTQISICKGAINGLVKALSAELAPSIRVNAVAPSLTSTSMTESLLNSEDKLKANEERHPLKRVGTPEDIANAIEMLLSDKSSWITGQILNVDGGIGAIK